jgi:hypothetical protein
MTEGVYGNHLVFDTLQRISGIIDFVMLGFDEIGRDFCTPLPIRPIGLDPYRGLARRRAAADKRAGTMESANRGKPDVAVAVR